MTGPIEAWHFIRADHRTGKGGLLVEPGQTLRVDPPLKLCRHGLHGCVRADIALSYAPGPVICRTLHTGEIVSDTDKLCSTERTCLWLANAERTLLEFACHVTEMGLRRVGVTDQSGYRGLGAQRAWLRGEISNEELDRIVGPDWRALAWCSARDAVYHSLWYTPHTERNSLLESMLWELKPKDV